MAGAIATIGEMDLGLDIGDYLGKTSPFPFVPLVRTHTLKYFCSSLLLTAFCFSSNWSYFCCNRFCLYIAGSVCGFVCLLLKC